jgi:hypothetical protein
MNIFLHEPDDKVLLLHSGKLLPMNQFITKESHNKVVANKRWFTVHPASLSLVEIRQNAWEFQRRYM